MKHQEKTLKKMEKSNILFDMSDPGTGKTFGQVVAYSRRRKKNGKNALVIAPRSLLRSAWEDDFRKFAPELTCSVATAINRQKAFDTKADVYITNTDAAVWLAKQKPAFFTRFDTLIIDEVDSFKHGTSARSKAINKIKKYFKYRSVLSGSPATVTICDVHNPVNILDDGARLGSSFFGFRAAVCSPRQVGPSREMVRWEDKPGAEETVYGLVADITVRHKLEECVDIPENFRTIIDYHLTDKQLKAYSQMEAAQVAVLSKTKVVSALQASSVRTKLLQIASGAVYESPDNYHVVDTERYELIIDLVIQRKHPIVFFLWKHQLVELVKQAQARKLKYAVINGDTSDKERYDIVTAYQAGFYDVVFGHPLSMAHGLTFTKGTSVIWSSPTDNLAWFKQGNHRQYRNGQKEKTEVVVVVAKGTIEERLYERCLVQGLRMNTFLELFGE
jgi:SNF2 family DNA or RNA helicase